MKASTLFSIVTMLGLVGCVSVPSGTLQLAPGIAADMKSQREGNLTSLSRGRPVYIEAFAYPQMLETGDILAGGQILLNLGREELSLDQIVGSQVEPAAETPAPAEKMASTKKAKKAKKNKRVTAAEQAAVPST